MCAAKYRLTAETSNPTKYRRTAETSNPSFTGKSAEVVTKFCLEKSIIINSERATTVNDALINGCDPETLTAIFFPRAYLKHKYHSPTSTKQQRQTYTAYKNTQWNMPTIFTTPSIDYIVACWCAILQANGSHNNIVSIDTLDTIYNHHSDNPALIYSIKKDTNFYLFVPAHPSHFNNTTTHSVVMVTGDTPDRGVSLHAILCTALAANTDIMTYYSVQADPANIVLDDVYTVLQLSNATPFYVAHPTKNKIIVQNSSLCFGISHKSFTFHPSELDVHHINIKDRSIYEQNTIFTCLINSGNISTTLNQHTHANTVSRAIIAPIVIGTLSTITFLLSSITSIVRYLPISVACPHLNAYHLCAVKPALTTSHIIAPHCLSHTSDVETGDLLPFTNVLDEIRDHQATIITTLFHFYNAQSNILFAKHAHQPDGTAPEWLPKSTEHAQKPFSSVQTDLDKCIQASTTAEQQNIAQLYRFIASPSIHNHVTNITQSIPTILLALFPHFSRVHIYEIPRFILITGSHLFPYIKYTASIIAICDTIYNIVRPYTIRDEYAIQSTPTGIDVVSAATSLVKQITCHAVILVPPSTTPPIVSASAVYARQCKPDEFGTYYRTLCGVQYVTASSGPSKRIYHACHACTTGRIALSLDMSNQITSIFNTHPVDMAVPKTIMFLHILSYAINCDTSADKPLRKQLDSFITHQLLDTLQPCVQEKIKPFTTLYANQIAKRVTDAYDYMLHNHTPDTASELDPHKNTPLETFTLE